MLAISAISAAAQHDSQRKTANTQADALKRTDELAQMDTARMQSQQAAQGAEEMNQAARSMQADLAALDTIAGEYGGGNTATRTRSTMGVQASEKLATIASNAKAGLNEASAGAFAARSRTNSQLRSIQGPSMVNTALQIGNAGVEAYDQYKTTKTVK